MKISFENFFLRIEKDLGRKQRDSMKPIFLEIVEERYLDPTLSHRDDEISEKHEKNPIISKRIKVRNQSVAF